VPLLRRSLYVSRVSFVGRRNISALGKVCYVYDDRNNVLLLMNCDQLLGYTPSNVTVRIGANALTYDINGRQLNLVTLR
jgi:hypothetical protein